MKASKVALSIRKKFKLWFNPTAWMCHHCGDHNKLNRKHCVSCGTRIQEDDGCAYLGQSFGGCQVARIMVG